MASGTLFAKIAGLVKFTNQRFFSPANKLGEFVIDITYSEEIEYSTTITEQPIEDGRYIVDHVFSDGVTVSISGSMADNPLGVIGAGERLINELQQPNVASRLFSSVYGISRRMSDAFFALEAIAIDKAPVDLVTTRKLYKNMMLTNLKFHTRNDQSLDIMNFTATLRSIETANVMFSTFNKTTKKPVAQKALAPVTDAGNQETVTISPASEKRNSIGRIILGSDKWGS